MTQQDVLRFNHSQHSQQHGERRNPCQAHSPPIEKRVDRIGREVKMATEESALLPSHGAREAFEGSNVEASR